MRGAGQGGRLGPDDPVVGVDEAGRPGGSLGDAEVGFDEERVVEPGEPGLAAAVQLAPQAGVLDLGGVAGERVGLDAQRRRAACRWLASR